jgi:predicted O-methyltransferase YrrM
MNDSRASKDQAANWERLLAEAERRLPEFLERTRGVAHAAKGIRRSEMFFLYALTAALPPRRILESGRARAQSTLVLSLLFPETAIVSVESNPDSADAKVAADRLHGRKNVECLFGDSRALLPQLLEADDIVLIDGPKDFRAVRLALQLLETGKPHAVFVHDLWPGSPARAIVDRLDVALLSDQTEWVRAYSGLDGATDVPAALLNGRQAYGPTFGCFLRREANYRALLFEVRLAQWGARIRATKRKLLRRPRERRPDDFEVFPG